MPSTAGCWACPSWQSPAHFRRAGPLQARGGCWFALPGSQLHLGVEEGFAPQRKAHPALVLRDLEAARAELVAAGVAIVPDTTLPNVRRFYAADPFGNRIEFIQAGDGFAER